MIWGQTAKFSESFYDNEIFKIKFSGQWQSFWKQKVWMTLLIKVWKQRRMRWWRKSLICHEIIFLWRIFGGPKRKKEWHMGDVRILWDWMGDVRKMERLEKHLCLGFLFGKTMKRIWNISGRDTLGYSEEEELYTVRFTQQYVQCQF